MKLKYLKNFKYWGKMYKRALVIDIVRDIIHIGIFAALWLTLHDTGLLLFIILMLLRRWKLEDMN